MTEHDPGEPTEDGAGSVLDFDHETTSEQRAADRKRNRSNRRKVLLGFLTALLVIALAGGAAAGYYVHRASSAIDKIKRENDFMPTGDGSTEPPRPPEPTSMASRKPITFVLMGSDSRGSDRGRSDSLMVAQVSGDRKSAYLISFPRDLWVDIPGRGKAKINAAYAWGGPKLTVQTLEQLTQVRMDHAVLIDFEGFIKLTDDLGGVLVYNKQASSSGRFNFPQGWITVRGEAALMYVRERKNLANGDFDRAERQRDVVKAILKKMMSREVVSDPQQFGGAMDTFARSLTVDSGLTKKAITSMARECRNLDPETGIRTLQAPIAGSGTSADGQWIALADEPKLKELSAALRSDTMASYVAKYPK